MTNNQVVIGLCNHPQCAFTHKSFCYNSKPFAYTYNPFAFIKNPFTIVWKPNILHAQKCLFIVFVIALVSSLSTKFSQHYFSSYTLGAQSFNKIFFCMLQANKLAHQYSHTHRLLCTCKNSTQHRLGIKLVFAPCYFHFYVYTFL